MYPVGRIHSERASVSVKPSPPFDASALLRRFSTPSPYTGLNSATGQSPVQSTAGPSSHEHGTVPPPEIPFGTAHTYNLTSRGRDYATLAIASRAPNVQDPPLLHFGDELNGSIVLPWHNVCDMQRMEVVFQLFESDPISPSYETKSILSSHQVDESCVSGGQFTWPFVITPPPALSLLSSSTTASGRVGSSLSHLSPRGYCHTRIQLIVKIYRRGRLTPNVALKQPIPIDYVPPPDPVMTSSPSLISTDLPSSNSADAPGFPVDSSWPQQKTPKVTVSGVMFHRDKVEVECKLIIPVSHPVSDVIPLRLVITSENREVLDLFAVSRPNNVRLLKVLAFGENAANIPPPTLINRSTYHRKDWVADAHWEPDARSWELPPSGVHTRARWRINLKGCLRRKQSAEISESFEQSGTALMYFVCLFPFSSPDFKPAADPKKQLFMGKLPITKQR